MGQNWVECGNLRILVAEMNSPLCWLSALTLTCAVATSEVYAGPSRDREPLRIDRDRLQRVDTVIEDYIARDQFAGAVMYVSRKGRTELLRAYGMQDREAEKQMETDSIFRLASMSKAVTTVAALMLYEEGKFMLNDPISKYIPEFKNPVVAVAPTADAPAGAKYSTVPAKREITIRDLMSHTAGLSYGGKNDTLAADEHAAAGVQGWYFADKDEVIGDVIKRLAKLPLVSQPGEKYVYGFSTDVLGYLVEVVSGQPLDQFFEERIFTPLKMKDTSFFLPREKVDRLVTTYGREHGKLVRTDRLQAPGHYVDGPRKCFSGGAGLLSTANDYGRFLQMLLNEGELDGMRLLSPKTVRLASENHVGDMHQNGNVGFGLGFWVTQDLGCVGELGSEGAYGWGSAYNPQYFVDPEEQMVGMILLQLMPATGVDINQKFKVLVYQSLVK
jgi:CubicO group peptidase (beta-lactamase class C family)